MYGTEKAVHQQYRLFSDNMKTPIGRKRKNKGKKAERELCERLTKIFGKKFIRNVTSGSYVGGKNIERTVFMEDYQTQMVLGDIIPPEEFSRMVIECKNHADFSISSLFFEKYAKIKKWIEQYELYNHEKKVNVLFIKEERKGWVVFMNEKYFSEIPEMNFLKLKIMNENYIIFSLDELEREKTFFKKMFSV